MKTPKENKNVLAFSGEFPHFAYFREGRWYEIHTHELLKGITHWEEIPELKPTKPKTAINQAIDEIHQEIANSKNPDALTKRGGEYRIGLQHAIVILMGLAEVEKEQIMNDFISGMEFIAVDPNRYKEDAEQYYNETYGGNK